MKTLLFTLCFFGLFFNLSSHATRPAKPAKLKYTFEEIFQFVLTEKKKEYRNEIALPQIFFESNTSLTKFQDSIEEQWGQRPNVFTNAYSVKFNEVFLTDDAKYYKKLKRCIDDSLVHELVHYVQSKYQNFDLNDDSLEMEAIEIQTLFREKFCTND